MNRKLNKKLSALDPRFRKKITDLFEAMNESISLLYDAATHDEKTGLYNNKFFETILDMEIDKAKRGNGQLSLMMLDIDFFKKINDKYGHMKADVFLERLAKILVESIRKYDIAARFGGEEFIVLLPGTSLNKAEKLANRIRLIIEEDGVLKKPKLTVSVGITEFRNKDSKKAFKQRADKALYQAKRTGRDKAIVVK